MERRNYEAPTVLIRNSAPSDWGPLREAVFEQDQALDNEPDGKQNFVRIFNNSLPQWRGGNATCSPAIYLGG